MFSGAFSSGHRNSRTVHASNYVPNIRYKPTPYTKSSTTDMCCFFLTLPLTFPYYTMKWLNKMADGH